MQQENSSFIDMRSAREQQKNPAFVEWRNAREELRRAYDRAWKTIDPYLHECVVNSERSELEVLTFILNQTDAGFPWETQLNSDMREMIAKRMLSCVRLAEFAEAELDRKKLSEAPTMLKALQRLTHPNADDTDLAFALDAIRSASQAE